MGGPNSPPPGPSIPARIYPVFETLPPQRLVTALPLVVGVQQSVLGGQPCERQSAFFCLPQRYRLQPLRRQRKPVTPVRSQPGCSVDWQPEQSLALLPLHYVTGHRLQCMSAAIGPTAVRIGTDTVGSIRASGCASKNNAFACGLKSDRTGEGEIPGSPARHFNNRLTLGGQIAHEAK